MRPSLVIQGGVRQTQQFLQQLLMADLSVDAVVITTHDEEAPQYQSLITASGLCSHLSIRMGTAADYQRAQWLVCVEPDESFATMADQVLMVRRITNRLLENGFRGQLIYVGDHDELATYFAWKYSGATPNKFWGLGTYAVDQLLTYRLAERLGVSPLMVQTTVVGRATMPVVAWSRTYVGSLPVLMYLANADTTLQANDLGKLASWLQREAGSSQTTLRFLTLVRLLRAVLDQSPLIGPVSHPLVDQQVAAATPVLVTAEGTQELTNLSLSEDEQRAYQEQLTAIRAEIASLEGTSMEGR